MMFRQLSLLAAALPAMALAGGANDVYYTGDGTANAVGQSAAASCASIGDNYAAINSDQWNSTLNCNKCIEVSCDDDRCSDQSNSVVVYVAGECAECADEAVDLSPAVFKKLTGSAPARYTIKWEFTECPTSFSALKSSASTYEAGKVAAADEKQSKVSILQANEEGVENQKDDSETQQTNAKSGAADAASGGTSPFIVALVVVGAVCGIALAAVFYTAKKKGNKHDECLTKSFDTFSSPSQKKKKATIATI
ncbi:hypothetical protein PHYPSEUDO_009298 [Phytophthora pseudosyringae]|uniref:Expansin-like EG45 domain-containing protein n=1 Tax=Phytophthora pseudosyringae TaxID=221518 RepID=A0A8T1VDA1_9STRA|nr:hypothetical protein PHYPSEUDO_009298 [Phytophthora pseudosyringae]